MYVARNAKQLQHEVKHAFLYTHNYDVSKKNPDFQIALLPIIVSDKTNHIRHLAILIHATFSKVNFLSKQQANYSSQHINVQTTQPEPSPDRGAMVVACFLVDSTNKPPATLRRIVLPPRRRKIVGRTPSPVISRGP